jgi:hypothetical protein
MNSWTVTDPELEPHSPRILASADDARSDARLLLLLAPWPGVGHPGALAPDLKASARDDAAEHRPPAANSASGI